MRSLFNLVLGVVVAVTIGALSAWVTIRADVPLFATMLVWGAAICVFGEFPMDAYRFYPVLSWLWYAVFISGALIILDGSRHVNPTGYRKVRGYFRKCWRNSHWILRAVFACGAIALICCAAVPVYKGSRLGVFSQLGAEVTYTRDLPGGDEDKVSSIKIDFSNVQLSDDQFLSLQPQLTSIDDFRLILHGTSITNRGLCALRNNHHLIDLNLYNTAVTDQGIVQIVGCSRLQTLNLSATQISDDAAESLRQFTNLQSVRVADTDFGEAGIAALHDAQLPELRLLEVSRRNVGEDQVNAGAGPAAFVLQLSDLRAEDESQRPALGTPKTTHFIYLLITVGLIIVGMSPFYFAYRDARETG